MRDGPRVGHPIEALDRHPTSCLNGRSGKLMDCVETKDVKFWKECDGIDMKKTLRVRASTAGCTSANPCPMGRSRLSRSKNSVRQMIMSHEKLLFLLLLFCGSRSSRFCQVHARAIGPGWKPPVSFGFPCQGLPIFKLRNELLQAIHDNQVPGFKPEM